MTMSGPRILVVEDDEALAPLVVRHLTDSGFQVHWVAGAEAARAHLAQGAVDLLVVDVMLPGEDGLSLCRRLRREHDVAIIMVTARGEESDRILGLSLGADDYLPKPFSLWELEARIRAVLRRCSAPGKHGPQPRRLGPFLIDVQKRTVSIDDRAVELTRTEFDLLARLTSEPGQVFSRDLLLECVQGGDTDAFDRAVDSHISNLRRKIERDPRTPTYVKTVWGIGYRFEAP
jgi:two-component system phosphate regulon response regulator OmpR